MLLPLMLRTLIEGSGAQGSDSQRELEHVRHGVDGTSHLPESEVLAAPASGALGHERHTTPQEAAEGSGEGLGTSDGARGRGAIKIGFFLHTPFPSSEIYR